MSLFDPSMWAPPRIGKHNSLDCSPTNRERELGLDGREVCKYSCKPCALGSYDLTPCFTCRFRAAAQPLTGDVWINNACYWCHRIHRDGNVRRGTIQDDDQGGTFCFCAYDDNNPNGRRAWFKIRLESKQDENSRGNN